MTFAVRLASAHSTITFASDGVRLSVHLEAGGHVPGHEHLQHHHGRVQATFTDNGGKKALIGLKYCSAALSSFFPLIIAVFVSPVLPRQLLSHHLTFQGTI